MKLENQIIEPDTHDPKPPAQSQIDARFFTETSTLSTEAGVINTLLTLPLVSPDGDVAPGTVDSSDVLSTVRDAGDQSSPDEPHFHTSIGSSLPMVRACIRTAISTGVITITTATTTSSTRDLASVAATSHTCALPPSPVVATAVEASQATVEAINSQEKATIENICGRLSTDGAGHLTPDMCSLDIGSERFPADLLAVGCDLSRPVTPDESKAPDESGWRRLKYINRRKQLVGEKLADALSDLVSDFPFGHTINAIMIFVSK